MKNLIKEKKLCLFNIDWKVQVLKVNDHCVILYYKDNVKFRAELMNFEIFLDMFNNMFCDEYEIFVQFINAIQDEF
jgi:hypothetical protein